MDELEKGLADQYALLSHVCLQIEGIKQFVSTHNDRLEMVVSKIEHEEIVSKIFSMIKSLEERIGSVLNDKEFFKNQLIAHEKMFEDIISRLKEHEKEHEMLRQVLIDHKKSIQSSKDEVNNNFHGRITKEVQLLHRRIDGIVIPTDYVKMHEVQAHVTSQMEEPALDIQNSMLTSKNHEMRLKMLEKKLQNLMLTSDNKKLERNE